MRLSSKKLTVVKKNFENFYKKEPKRPASTFYFYIIYINKPSRQAEFAYSHGRLLPQSSRFVFHHLKGFVGNEVFHTAGVFLRRSRRNAVFYQEIADNAMLFKHRFGVRFARFGEV